MQELRDTGLKLDDMGHPSDYIGVNLSKEDGVFHFTQRALIDFILEDVGLANSKKTKPVPAKSSQILQACPGPPPFDGPFNIRSVVGIGKLNYLAQTTRPDIMQAVHSIAKFVSNPRKKHGEAVMYLYMYLNKARDIGLKFKPDPTKGFEDYCDADFIGQYDKEYSTVDPSTVKSRSDGLSSTLDVRSFGLPSFRRKLLYLPLRPNISACLHHLGTLFRLCLSSPR